MDLALNIEDWYQHSVSGNYSSMVDLADCLYIASLILISQNGQPPGFGSKTICQTIPCTSTFRFGMNDIES